MVKFLTSSTTYDYPLPAVSLAYFLRYPNPHAKHVLSTDVISRIYDAETSRLTTTRLHLKQSKLPAAILKLLPSNITGSGPKGPNGEAQNFILETSIVDVKEGWMETESVNLQYTGVLSVVERQRYERPKMRQEQSQSKHGGLVEASKDETTECTTTVTFHSRVGQAIKSRHQQHQQRRLDADESDADTDAEPKKGFFSSWSTAALQRTIEATGLQRTRTAMVRSKEGMNVVLERLRTGGLGGVLEGMRRDRETFMLGHGAKVGANEWKKVLEDGENKKVEGHDMIR
jgi:4-amino-4-deoxychorismate lyase